MGVLISIYTEYEERVILSRSVAPFLEEDFHPPGVRSELELDRRLNYRVHIDRGIVRVDVLIDIGTIT